MADDRKAPTGPAGRPRDRRAVPGGAALLLSGGLALAGLLGPTGCGGAGGPEHDGGDGSAAGGASAGSGAAAGPGATGNACGAPRPGAGAEPPVDVALEGLDPDIETLLADMLARAREEPEDGARRGRLGMAYEVASVEDAAVDSYAQAIDLDPGEPRWHYYYAMQLARKGDLAGAIDRVDCVLRREPDYAPAHLYRAQWAFDLGREDEALASYRRATELEPGNPAGGMGEARILLNRGENDRALAVLQDLDARFRHPYLRQLIGRAWRQKGDLDKAQAILSTANAGSAPPGWPDPWNDEKLQFRTGFSARLLQAGKLMRRGETAQAVNLLEQLHAERPEDVATINNLSVAYTGLRRFDDSLRLLRGAVERYPDYFPFHLNLADLYMRANDANSALRHLDRAIELNPTLSHAWEQKGTLLLRQRRLDEALEAMEQAIAYDARDPNVFLTAAVLAVETKRHQRGLELSRQAVELNPSSGPAHLVVATAAMEVGRFDEARAALDRAESLGTHRQRIARARSRLAQLDPEG